MKLTISGNELRRRTCRTTGLANRKHGLGTNKTPTYHSWRAMRVRCLTQNDKDYHNYGGRGITICKRWEEFLNFIEDMGERPDGMTLDRIDNDGNYEPSNCRWSTRKEQGLNRRTTRWVEKDGLIMTVDQWRKKLGVHSRVIHRMIKMGELNEINHIR